MVGRKARNIPASLARGRDRFENWRGSRKVRSRIPNQLWDLAVKLAVAYGLNRAASVLKLDYYSLKKRVEAKDAATSSVASAFVEVSPLESDRDALCEWALYQNIIAHSKTSAGTKLT